MNKKLLAAAIASATIVGAPAAFAESTVYGKLHTSIDYDNPPGGPNKTYNVQNRASRLGFKGSEDLGNGLKAIYQIELGIRSDGGNQQSVGDGHTGQRNTFVGLSGGWGTALVGRHDTPTKMAFYATGNERIGDSIIDLNPGSGAPIGVFTEVRANNAIAYVSPNFAGFTFAAATIPGEETGKTNSANGLADHYSFGLMYSGYGLKAGAGYEKFDNQGDATLATNVRLSDVDLGSQPSGAPETDIKVFQIGASYTFMGNFSIGGQYQDTKIKDGGPVVDPSLSGDVKYKAWAVTGKATFGNNAISAVYTDAKADAGPDLIKFRGWGLAGEHNFSKRTKAYVAYANGKDKERDDLDKKDGHTFSLGMIHNF
jgi:predicted porin